MLGACVVAGVVVVIVVEVEVEVVAVVLVINTGLLGTLRCFEENLGNFGYFWVLLGTLF